jgi:DNA polymerase III sliding clamp (beta) subunit (PCNA family)
MKKDIITEEKAKQTPAGGVLVGKREGQTIIHDKGTEGGYFVGKLHKEGGIEGINKSTGQPIEVQGGEVIITAPAVADQTKREFEGEMLTNREILSKINERGGGVSLENGGEIYFNGSSYNYGGKTMTDYEIMQSMNNCGCEHEYKGGGNLDPYKSKIADLKRENKSTYPKVPTNKIFFNQIEVLPSSVVSTADPYLEDETKLPTESVDLKNIVPTQKMVTIPNIESTKEVELYPVLFKLNDKYYVLDGHHRITNAILKDEKEVMSYVYDYKTENLDKFNNGGQLDLVDESKKGDHTSRDLNNYNDLLDVGADGQVGMDNGLAFEDGGFMADVYADGGEIGGNFRIDNQFGSFTTIKVMPIDENLRVSKDYFSVQVSVRVKKGEETIIQQKPLVTYPVSKYKDFINDLEKRNAKKFDSGGDVDCYADGGATLSAEVFEWDKVPTNYRNISKVKKVPFTNNPMDKGLDSIISPFLGKDELRPVGMGVNFDKNGITATDYHKLIILPYPNEKYNGIYDINKVKKTKAEQPILIDGNYPDYENVVPKSKDAKFVYQVDVYKLLQYTKTAMNYSNKVTHAISFKYGENESIGFNGKFLSEVLTTALKLGHEKLYAFITTPNRAMLLSSKKDYEIGSDEILLLMPVMLKTDFQEYYINGYGTNDPDYNRSLKAYFDFNDSEIHNADGSVAEFKMQYENNLSVDDDYLALLSKITKKYHDLPILSYAKVEDGKMTATNLEISLVVKDVKIPDGIYEIVNNAPNITMQPIEDFPKERVFKSNEVFVNHNGSKSTAFEFITFSEVFEFYLDKLLLSVGKDDLRPTMSGICIKKTSDNELFLVTTNAHTLCKINITEYCEFNKDDRELEYILPVQYLKDFVKLADGALHFKCNISNIFIEADNLEYIAKAIDGKYPNYEAVIPKQNNKMIVFDHAQMNKCLKSKEYQDLITKYKGQKDIYFNLYNIENKLFVAVNLNKGANSSSNTLEQLELCNIDFNFREVEKTFYQSDSLFLSMNVMHIPKENQYFLINSDFLKVMLDTITDTEVECYFTEPNKPLLFPIDAIDYKKTLPEEKTKQQPKKVAKAKKEAVNVEKEQVREAIETLLMLAEIEENEEQRKEIYEALEILNMLKENSYEYGGALGKKLTFEPIRTPLN